LHKKIPTTVFYDQSEDFVSWIVLMANFSNPPLVMTISYGTLEGYMHSTELDQWNTEAIKLGLQGVTLVASSGDSGVSGVFDDLKYCGYGPVFPCSSPYVTSVGALQPQISGSSGKFTVSSLVACQSNLGGSVTSGGGFSNYYPTPSWQSQAVSTYFNSLPTKLKPYTITTGPPRQQLPQKSYNSKGRGYPDISAWGAYVWIKINGTLHIAAGTSVSAPIVAGMISLVNAQRLQNGLHPLGWLNPLLYGANSFIRDVTSGDNKCMLASYDPSTAVPNICCLQGFYATNGWDPVTGLGYIDFFRFSKALNLKPNNPSSEHILSPSAQLPVPATSVVVLSIFVFWFVLV